MSADTTKTTTTTVSNGGGEVSDDVDAWIALTQRLMRHQPVAANMGGLLACRAEVRGRGLTLVHNLSRFLGVLSLSETTQLSPQCHKKCPG